jgi:hypothetical protein
LRKRHASRFVGVYSNNKNVSMLGSEFQESEMTGMNDVKVPGDKSYAFTIAASQSYFTRIC